MTTFNPEASAKKLEEMKRSDFYRQRNIAYQMGLDVDYDPIDEGEPPQFEEELINHLEEYDKANDR